MLPSLFPVGKGWLGRSGKLSFQNQARNPFDPVQHLRPLGLALSQDMVSTRSFMFNQLIFQRNGGNCRRRDSKGTMSSEPRSRVFLSIQPGPVSDPNHLSVSPLFIYLISTVLVLYTSSHPYTIRAYIIPSIQPDDITARTSDLDQGFPKYFPPQGPQPAGEMVPARVLCLPYRRGHGLPGGRNIL